MTIGSLFAGIGGLELGLEWAGLGPVRWQVEQDDYCRAVLARHWPGAARYDDVRTVGAHNLAPVDLVCGGFPCQDLSTANARGRGLAGERSGLWFHMLRVIDALRPALVVVENVHAPWRRWLPVVRGGLWSRGYASVPVRVRAADVGARHLRARIFVVAYADAGWQLESDGRLADERGRAGDAAARSGADADRGGLRQQPRRRGPARPDPPEPADAPAPGRRPAAEPAWSRLCEPWRWRDAGERAADAHRARLAGWARERGDDGGERAAAERDGDGGVEPWLGAGAAESALVRALHGIPAGLDRAARGVARRRIAALGNAVVPACAEVVGRMIVECRRSEVA